MPKSTLASQTYLNAQYRNIPFTPPPAIYVAVFTVAPGVGGGGTEVSGGSYVRQAVTFGAPVGNVITNSADVIFPTATANWGTLVGYGYMDAISGGNLISFSSFSSPRLIQTTDILRLPAGFLVITEV